MFEVLDEKVLISHVRRRLAEDRGYSPHDVAEHTQDVEQAVLMLFEMDDWTADYEREGAEFGGSAFHVDRIGASADVGMRLRVTARWDYLIRREEVFRAYVDRRVSVGGESAPHPAMGSGASAGAALRTLFSLDGWPKSYPTEVLSLVEQNVEVVAVEATLSEREDDEWAERSRPCSGSDDE